MDVCSRTPNRTEPVGDDLHRRGDVRLCSRTNGWTWPPHPFQLLAWLLYVFFAVTGFGVFVPLLPAHWIPAGYICTGVLFLGHLCVHVLAVSVDPADHNVRRKAERGPLPAFDRSKHAHVIENCHCYLCQVDVGSKSKHCSSCNKCVANFDHHCRWLNNCVGSRNYKLFLHSVVSALLGVFLVLVLASYVFIEFFIDPNNLRTDQHFQMRNDSGVWFVFLPVAPLRSAAAVIPGLAAVTMALALLSSVLLCHLLCFHIYLMWNRLSTYEYIVRQRHRLDSRDSRKAGSEKETVAPPALQNFDSSGTLGFTNTQLDVEAEPVRAEPGFLANGRVSSVSNPVVEEAEAPATFSTAMAHPNRNTQKKKKVRRIPVEVIGEQAPPPAPPPDLSNVGQRLPFPAFSLRAPVQAAAPPAEYHSDSAESLEEIPVALAKLGSTSQRVLSAFPRRPSSLRRPPPPRRPSSLRRPPPPRGPSSPQPRTKRKLTSSRLNKNSVELRFELAPQSPTVFVTRASGGAAESQEEVLIQGQRLAGSRPGPGSRPGSQASLSSGAALWTER